MVRIKKNPDKELMDIAEDQRSLTIYLQNIYSM